MLRTRVITALVLVAILLPGLFYLPQSWWALLVAAFIGLGAWEWGALLGWQRKFRLILGIAVGLGCAGIARIDPAAIGAASLPGLPERSWVLGTYGLAAAFWCLLVPLWLRRKWLPNGMGGALTGIVVLVPTWLAMVQLRALGPGVLLGMFTLVWVADIAAYFSGKTFGKHKLAPVISPGKTWEGAIGATFGVVAYGLLLRAGAGFDLFSVPLSIVALIGVTVVSVVGDLFESLLKRKAGIKDSGSILPGHGGVLDRIDSLTSTLPLVALLWLLVVYFPS